MASWPSSGRAAGRVGELREVGPPLAVLTLHVVTCSRAGGRCTQTPAPGAQLPCIQRLRQAPGLASQALSLPGPGQCPPAPITTLPQGNAAGLRREGKKQARGLAGRWPTPHLGRVA